MFIDYQNFLCGVGKKPFLYLILDFTLGENYMKKKIIQLLNSVQWVIWEQCTRDTFQGKNPMKLL